MWKRQYRLREDGNPDTAASTVGKMADFFFAFGRTKVRSEADLTATRKGNMVFFEGTVTHEWDDNYDFQPMQDLADGAIALQDGGRAKPFRFGANWTQRVQGTAEIRNGKLTNPKAQWTDIER